MLSKVWTRLRHSTLASMLLILVFFGSVAAIVLLQSNFPSTSIPVQSVTLNSSCPATPPPSLNTTSSPTPVSGVLLYNCGGNPAFTVTALGVATPTYTITTSPAFTTSLGYTPHGSGCSSPAPLPSGTRVSFTVLAGYDYCLSYSGVPTTGGTINPFSVSWS